MVARVSDDNVHVYCLMIISNNKSLLWTDREYGM